jgi:nucleotide-binding universal stress UspA family protein
MPRMILHATDFSDHSAYALDVALVLARAHGARLVLVHVAPAATALAHAALVPVLTAHHENLRHHLRQLAPSDANLTVETRLEQGDAADAIVRVAQETQADLLVLGTHGRSGLSRLFMGSVAEDVLRKAACPVILVKVPSPEAAPSKSTEAG